MKTRSSILHTAVVCDEQDAWTDETVMSFGWLSPTVEDKINVTCYRELYTDMDATVGYVLH